MRKKMLLLVLALTAVVASLQAPRAQADDGYYCPQCTTYADGTQCCIPCWCYPNGVTFCNTIGCDSAGDP